MSGTAWQRVLFAVSLVVGCTGDGEQERPQASQAEIFCEAMCRRNAECGGGVVSSCESYCVAQTPLLGNFRREYVASASACIRGIACSSFYLENSFDPCWEQAEGSVEPTEDVRAFCEPWCTRWFECGYSCSVSACEDGWVLLSDAFLERMLEECVNEPCENLEACQERVETEP
jgi:hypothetical protein